MISSVCRGRRLGALALLALCLACAAPGRGPAAPGGSPATAGAGQAAAPTAPANPPAVASAPPQRTTVRVGTVPGAISNAGRFVAIERGYFREEGIDFDDVAFDTSAKMLPALAAGQIELGIGGISAGLFNAVAQGIPLRIVLDSTSAYPGDSAGGLLVRKELIDSGAVREIADLRGRTVAITSKGQGTEIAMSRALAQGGLSLGDVEVAELAYPDMTLALGNGNVDAAISIEPFAVQAVSRGFAVMFRDWGSLIPNDHMAVVMYSQAFANTDAALRYAKAYVRGIRDYEAARTQGKDREAIIAILMQYSALKDRALYDQMHWLPLNPDGRVNGETFVAAQDWFADHGYVRTKINLDEIIDQRFADYAVAQLGPYR
ncbi:MAG TPA: ABC transporter substrate-binding protein [Chloroflexota bacterium]|nr:ABC transporter substrate-binding protein [Chloroflexota bacterium]